jgi:hypothetical protein
MTVDVELTLDDVMAQRFALVEQIAIIQGKHKAELEPFNEELAMCEAFIQRHMITNGLQSAKTAAGQAFFKSADSVTVEDAEAFFDYVFEHGARELLNNAANKTAVKEFIEANKAVPPGIKFDSFRKLNWMRGKG